MSHLSCHLLTFRIALLYGLFARKARIVFYASLYLKFFGLASIVWSVVLFVVLFVLGYHWIVAVIFIFRIMIGRKAF